MNAEADTPLSQPTSGNPDVDFLWSLAIGSGVCLQRDLTVLQKDFNKKRLSTQQLDAIKLQIANIKVLADGLLSIDIKDENRPLHHSERWLHPVTGVSAVISQWRGQDAHLKIRDVDVKTASLEECQADLTTAGFHRCNSL